MPGPRKAAWGGIDVNDGCREGGRERERKGEVGREGEREREGGRKGWREQQDAGNAVQKLALYYPIIWKALRQCRCAPANIIFVMIIFLRGYLILK